MKRKLMGLGILVIAASLVSVSVSAAAPDLAEHYLAIQTALAGDSLEKVGEHAAAIEQLVNTGGNDWVDTDSSGIESRTTDISAAAKNLVAAKDLQEARLAFGVLSEILVESYDLIPEGGVKVAYCSMAKKHWFQTGDEISNPYYGSKMLRCGQFVPQSETTN
jgi:hypothetical protein